VRNDNWNHLLELLIEYSLKNGHALVPRDYVTQDGFKLGDWVIHQRHIRSKLSEDRIEALESVKGGFGIRLKQNG
jgi:hypothetical protein